MNTVGHIRGKRTWVSLPKRRKDSLLRMNTKEYLFEEQPKLAKQLEESGELEEFLDNKVRLGTLVLQQCKGKGLNQGQVEELLGEVLYGPPEVDPEDQDQDEE